MTKSNDSDTGDMLRRLANDQAEGTAGDLIVICTAALPVPFERIELDTN